MTMNNNNNNNNNYKFFGFADAQNVSPFSYPSNINNLSNLYDVSIPQKLPEVRIGGGEDEENDEDNVVAISKDSIVHRDWVSNIISQLHNLLKQIPVYPMPPLINVYRNNNNNNNKRVNAYVDEIVNNGNDDNFRTELFLGGKKLQQQQQQQQNASPSSSSSPV